MDKKPARIALIVFSIALFLCGLTSPVAATTVAHWKFEEGQPGAVASGPDSILDSSGNDQHGTPIGGPIYTSVTNPNSIVGLQFDGVNDFIILVCSPS